MWCETQQCRRALSDVCTVAGWGTAARLRAARAVALLVALLSAASLLVAVLACAPAATAGEWPTLHRDNQRSGYTDEVVQGPYERKWFRNFSDEMVATRVEAIVAEGKCFVGTCAGRMRALNVADGSTVWTFSARGPVGASPCYSRGKLYFGADDGLLYCLRASDGKRLWAYRANGGIWASPACDGKRVYVGDRAGAFYAVAADTGKRLWTYHTGGMVLTPASLSEDGTRVVFGSEDMHVYCLSTGGQLLWRSPKLGGLSLRDHAPTIWMGLAIVRTNPANSFHHAAGENPAVLTQAQKALPMLPEDKVIFDRWGSFAMRLTARRLDAEQRAVLGFLARTPAERTFYAFNLADGKEPWVAPVLYTAGLHNTPSPPTFNPHTGELYTWVPTALSNYSAGVPGGAIAVGRLDRRSGRPEILWHTNGDRLGWAFDFAAPADESQSLSLMRNTLLNTHQGIIGGMDLSTLKWHHVYIARDTYGGIFGPAALPGGFEGAEKAHADGVLGLMSNEWHGPDRAVVSIAEGRIFWMAGSQVVCIAGPSVPKTATGGTTPPPPIRRKEKPAVPAGNVATSGVGRYDASVARVPIAAGQLAWMVASPTSAAAPTPALLAPVRARLNAAVTELVDEGPWAPFIVELGISGEERHFWRSAETMQTVALAIPFLTPGVRAKAKRYLDRLWAGGMPLDRPTWPVGVGRRREPYDLGPEMLAYANTPVRYQASVEDLYAVWAYAQYANAWPKVLAALPRIRAVWQQYASQPVRFDNDDMVGDAAERLNGEIAGTLAYARIAMRAGQRAEADVAMSRLAELVTERVHHERADTRFVRETRVAHYALHQAKVPRYVGLTPEVGLALHLYAGKELRRNLRLLTTQLPMWYQAYGERLIGGENYISPPHLARALFAALAYGGVATSTELVAKLDQPWCRADLYWMEKLTATLRAALTRRPNG